MPDSKAWDPYSIKAEIERRGSTLTAIAVESGLYESACRQGLRGGSYAGAVAIAKFLGISIEKLFPGMYVHHLARENRIRKGRASASQKRPVRADAARAS